MKANWYLSTLLFILALFGFSQKQMNIPNQEIVVQFANDDISCEVAQNAISIVQRQLQSIGADNIQISEPEHGSFKFTYYSKIDVASIKEIFSTSVPLEASVDSHRPGHMALDGEQEQSLAIGFTSYSQTDGQKEIPSEENTNRYELNVCEIQKSNDLESDFNGILIELSRENDRLVNPNLYYSFGQLYVFESKEVQKSEYIVQREIALAINNSTRIIPEVRAGPVANGNS